MSSRAIIPTRGKINRMGTLPATGLWSGGKSAGGGLFVASQGREVVRPLYPSRKYGRDIPQGRKKKAPETRGAPILTRSRYGKVDDKRAAPISIWGFR